MTLLAEEPEKSRWRADSAWLVDLRSRLPFMGPAFQNISLSFKMNTFSYLSRNAYSSVRGVLSSVLPRAAANIDAY